MINKISEYIHYYIGQPCTYDDPYTRAFGLLGEVTEIIIQQIRNPQLTGAVRNVKPHLRQLSDMTEKERKHIWLLLVKRPFPNSGNIHWFEETSRLAKRCCMMSGLDRVGIEMNGHVWWDCDLNVQKYNPHIVTHYLLQQGFDLWELIPSGQAVDLKTIQQ